MFKGFNPLSTWGVRGAYEVTVSTLNVRISVKSWIDASFDIKIRFFIKFCIQLHKLILKKLISTGFMAVRQTCSGIHGWIISSKNDGFMDGQCTIFNAGVYRTPVPNTLHRLLPDTDCSPTLMSYTIFFYQVRIGYQ